MTWADLNLYECVLCAKVAVGRKEEKEEFVNVPQ